MIINRQPQFNQNKRFIFDYQDETITATLQEFESIIDDEGNQVENIIAEQSDEFDLSDLQIGDLYEGAETILQVNPIINAVRNSDGVLVVDLLYWIPENASESDKYPELIEV